MLNNFNKDELQLNQELNVENFNYFENAMNDINNNIKARCFTLEDIMLNQSIEEKHDILNRQSFSQLFYEYQIRRDYAILRELVELINSQDGVEEEEEQFDEIDFYIKSRKHRDFIKNSRIIRKFLIGDILEFVYKYKNMALTFSGICISLKKKSFVMPDLSLILRNVIVGVGIELTISYFYNFAYKMLFLDYRRKFFHYNKNKLYFIRNRVNRESKV